MSPKAGVNIVCAMAIANDTSSWVPVETHRGLRRGRITIDEANCAAAFASLATAVTCAEAVLTSSGVLPVALAPKTPFQNASQVFCTSSAKSCPPSTRLFSKSGGILFVLCGVTFENHTSPDRAPESSSISAAARATPVGTIQSVVGIPCHDEDGVDG
ncbi:Uncharacterised protein [Mycobacteroides abscessus subsp. abscessus]|nr:Uncharacterised protein [Mycobacteroides abscessus subsp. abscessus]